MFSILIGWMGWINSWWAPKQSFNLGYWTSSDSFLHLSSSIF